MIVILSYPGDDNTNKVIEWLKYYKVQYRRIHLKEENYQKIEISFIENKLNCCLKLADNSLLDFKDISFFVYRGGGFKINQLLNDTVLDNEIFENYIEKDLISLVNYFYSEINKKSIGYCYLHDLNKLSQLKTAIAVGLDVPSFILTNEKSSFNLKFKNSNTITKAIQENIAIDSNNNFFLQRVQKVDQNDLEDEFFSSFFQEEIEKEYELRIFYLDGKFYSIALISNNETIDMRDNYHKILYEPYTLPKYIEEKICAFMNKMELISGSIDMLKSTSGKYYFLEVNPEGQYDWVSVYGGYNLHHEIVKFLIKKENEYFKKKSIPDLF